MEEFPVYAKGTCTQMCPEDEIILREREGLIHVLEALKEKGSVKRKRLKADRLRMVKAFSRSAAGANLTNPKYLRPINTLLQTVNYLLHDIVTVEYLPFNVVYDFIVDRLSAVRQDMVVQNLSVAESISLLQPITRFYAYASYRLCGANLSCFDPTLNGKHLQECLKKLLFLYDRCDYTQNLLSKVLHGANVDCYEALFRNKRETFEAMYVLWNLGDNEALVRGLGLSKKWRTGLVTRTLEMSLCYRKKNWVRLCRMLVELPAFLAVVASRHLPSIRRQALMSMTIGYNIRNSQFPGDIFRELLLYSTKEDLKTDCQYYCVLFDEDKDQLLLRKESFAFDKPPVSPRRETFIDKHLQECDVPALLMYDAD